ncbi:GlxA family transcriptional regulator [Bradyrhizobium sp. 48]|uniref:GlxA family transcriptional regulator n=1 Tax=Bradyrhizobium sp. 48 TaxID=2782676 RepID=UPI001FF6FE55|nr:GlxA family transcriptional regulator [Bradyrhizobium sp. 48]MCK1446691.1 GlxA family transcriptional regulator [Bradyrhizobium sp. 48]
MQTIGFVVFPGFGVMSFAAVSVFETANTMAGEAHYDVHLLSETGGPVRSSIGVVVETKAFDSIAVDTLIIGGGGEMSFTPGLLAFLKASVRCSRRVAATCTGAFYLAEAGLLNDREATTHWFYADNFRSRYPNVRLKADRLFVVDGTIWTSAGMTAGVDQALAMVEEDLGTDVVRATARNLVVHHQRAGGQPQSSAMLEMNPKSDRIQDALAFARRNLDKPLTVELLAENVKLSPRQFSRIFRAETGRPPAKAVEQLRVEAARNLLEQSVLSVDIIARQTGFSDRERMRRAFVRAFGEPPQAIQRRRRESTKKMVKFGGQ